MSRRNIRARATNQRPFSFGTTQHILHAWHTVFHIPLWITQSGREKRRQRLCFVWFPTTRQRIKHHTKPRRRPFPRRAGARSPSFSEKSTNVCALPRALHNTARLAPGNTGRRWMTRFGSQRDCVMAMGLGRLKPPHWLPLPAGTGEPRDGTTWRKRQTNTKISFCLPRSGCCPSKSLLPGHRPPDRLISSVSSARPPPWSSFFNGKKKEKEAREGGKSMASFPFRCALQNAGGG